MFVVCRKCAGSCGALVKASGVSRTASQLLKEPCARHVLWRMGYRASLCFLHLLNSLLVPNAHIQDILIRISSEANELMTDSKDPYFFSGAIKGNACHLGHVRRALMVPGLSGLPGVTAVAHVEEESRRLSGTATAHSEACAMPL